MSLQLCFQSLGEENLSCWKVKVVVSQKERKLCEYICENEWEEIITSSHHTKNKRKPPTLLRNTFNGGLCVYLYIVYTLTTMPYLSCRKPDRTKRKQ